MCDQRRKLTYYKIIRLVKYFKPHFYQIPWKTNIHKWTCRYASMGSLGTAKLDPGIHLWWNKTETYHSVFPLACRLKVYSVWSYVSLSVFARLVDYTSNYTRCRGIFFAMNPVIIWIIYAFIYFNNKTIKYDQWLNHRQLNDLFTFFKYLLSYYVCQ